MFLIATVILQVLTPKEELIAWQERPQKIVARYSVANLFSFLATEPVLKFLLRKQKFNFYYLNSLMFYILLAKVPGVARGIKKSNEKILDC